MLQQATFTYWLCPSSQLLGIERFGGSTESSSAVGFSCLLAACSNLLPVGHGVSQMKWREMKRWQKCTLSAFCKEQWGIRKDHYKIPRIIPQQYFPQTFRLAVSPLCSRKENKVQRISQPFLLFQDSFRNDCSLCSEQLGHCNDSLRWRTEAQKGNVSCLRPPWMPAAKTEIKLRSPGSQSRGLTVRHSFFLPSDKSGGIGQHLPFHSTARQRAGKNHCEKRQGSASARYCLEG